MITLTNSSSHAAFVDMRTKPGFNREVLSSCCLDQLAGNSLLPSLVWKTPTITALHVIQAVLLAEALSCEQLVQMLGSMTFKSLRATCSQLRKALQSLAKSVRLKASMDVLVKNYFHLESLQFRHPSMLTMSIMAQGHWPNLKKLILRGQKHPILVEPEAIVHLTQGEWPGLEVLDLSFNSLPAEAMAQLIHGHWPQLAQLELVHCNLDVFGLCYLPKGNWIKLLTLNLEDNPNLGETGAHHLCQGQWPALQCLQLGSAIDAMAICCLPMATWKDLKHISLSGANFTGSCAQKFKLGQWPNLRCLQLRKCNINSASMSSLVEGNWPHLTHLNLHGNALDSHGFELLSQAHWPSLEVLILSNTMASQTQSCVFDMHVAADYIAKLSRGQWSSLVTLDLSENAPYFGFEAMQKFIASPGTWQGLQKFDLSSNNFSPIMVESLAAAKLPRLRSLNLANCALSPFEMQILGTSHWQMLECLVVGPGQYDVDWIRALQGTSGRQLRKGPNNVAGWTGLASGHWPSIQVLVIADSSEWFHRWQ